MKVIIPAYNEKGRLVNVIKKLLSCPEIEKIIVVDDGSTDSTYSEIKDFDIEIKRHKKNKGKGMALKTGLSKIDDDAFLLVDADLKNLQKKHIKTLLSSFNRSKDIVLVNGVIDRGKANPIAKHAEKLITGIRILKKEVWEKVSKKDFSGYEVDYLIYKTAKKMGKMKTEVLPGLSHYTKTEKDGFFKGSANHLKMYGEIIYRSSKKKR